MANHTLLKVKVRDSENTIYDGEVDRISSFNENGPFDVFPMHANFISIIKKELHLYAKGSKVKELKLEQAVLKIKQDVAHIFLGIEAFTLDDAKPSSNTQNPPKK